jgi:tRNA pseudouridine38-40 synthase
MSRYFLEVAYKGSCFSGFQVQANANTIQGEIENAFNILNASMVKMTGSSRTDAGVHALQNYFHFDFDRLLHPQFIYQLNAILPPDIVAKSIHEMPENAHARFDARSRYYQYRIYRFKNPFYLETGYYYPYQLEFNLLQEAAEYIKDHKNFYAFTKMNTAVKNYECTIYKSEWVFKKDVWIYHIEANRFLRGMIRLLTATMLQLARKKISLESFQSLFQSDKKCGYSIPATGLFLTSVTFPQNYFKTID